MDDTKITLRNLDRAAEQHVRSADGESIQIQPGTVVTVDAKFGWNPPAKVEVVKARVVAVASATGAPTATTVVAAPVAASRRTVQAVPAAE